MQETGKSYPASQDLENTVASTSPPAVITVVSSLTQDADSLTIALDKLGEEGYSTVLVGVGPKK